MAGLPDRGIRFAGGCSGWTSYLYHSGLDRPRSLHLPLASTEGSLTLNLNRIGVRYRPIVGTCEPNVFVVTGPCRWARQQVARPFPASLARH